MGGAATISSTILAVSKLNLSLNIIGISPLCENLPSGKALKPGDVIFPMNKKSIEVDNTDAEGRLILADSLCYASEFNPTIIVDVATLTGAIVIALGDKATGCYSTTNELWRVFEQAGYNTGDLFWRMPLFNDYINQMKSRVADFMNTGGKQGGSCTAAIFLKQYVDFEKVKHYAHLDIAGTAMMKNGMSGKPTRGLIEFCDLLIKSDFKLN